MSYYTTSDKPQPATLNQKMAVVGTGEQIANLSNTYAGQYVYCTVSGNGFSADRVYVRDSLNTLWYPGIKKVTEASNAATVVSDNGSMTCTANHRYYAYFTLPATEKLYYITGIEWKNSGTGTTSIYSGVDIMNANPPTVDHTLTVAMGTRVSQNGVDQEIQRTSPVWSYPIRASKLLGVWVGSTVTMTMRALTGQAALKFDFPDSGGFDQQIHRAGTWATDTDRAYIKVYYVGYK